jgi:hypothetical protein
MSIYGPDNATVNGNSREDVYDYVDSVVKGITGDRSSKLVRDISLFGKKIIDLGQPDRDTDAATKSYVDSNPNYITVWASAKGRLVNGQYQFGFGGGSKNVKNNGYVMLCDGVIEKVGLVGGSTNIETGIWLTINGVDRVSLIKTSTQQSRSWPLTLPLSIKEGEVINFRVHPILSEISNAKMTTVNLLIRLMM